MRFLLPCTTALLCCMLLVAQDRQDLPPGVRSQQYASNKVLIESMVNHAVLNSKSPGDLLVRTDSYSSLFLSFAKELDVTADPSRQAELRHHLQQIVQRGVKPTVATISKRLQQGTQLPEYPTTRTKMLTAIQALSQSTTGDPALMNDLSDLQQSLPAAPTNKQD